MHCGWVTATRPLATASNIVIQLTGKENYMKFTVSHNAKNPDDPRDFVANPDLLKTDLRYGIESAYFFWDTKHLNEIADADDVEAVTLAVLGI